MTLLNAIKHIHVWLVLASIAGFILRFYWSFRYRERLQKPLARIAPHIVDTCLLLSGVALAVGLGYSLTHWSWFTLKLLLILLYILLGIIAMKSTGKLRLPVGLCAIGAFFAVMYLAISKPF